jgi:hypothetical protein
MNQEVNFIEEELNVENKIKIYSKKTIFGFSVLFAPIFGGVMLRQNLVDIGNKKTGNLVLLYSIVFTALTYLIVSSIEMKSRSITYLLNIGWSAILTEYFYKKYFPLENYEYKKIWKPLIISILILIPLILAALYFPNE